MNTSKNKTIVVAGGTGNVGSFLVAGLLGKGATVAVPSRSEQKINELKDHLLNHVDESVLANLHTYLGDLSDESEAEEVRGKIIQNSGEPDGVVATLGHLVPAPSLLDVSVEEMETVLKGNLIAHHMVAKTFLPGLRKKGGNYVFINGPLALKPWKGSGTALVSITTAAQQMLFKSLAQELEDDEVTIAEVITYAFIRNKKTQPGSALTGEDLGNFVASLASGALGDTHGQTFQLESAETADNIIRERAMA